MEFEWDPAKATANEAKHGVSFEEALEIFSSIDKLDVDATRDNDREVRRKSMAYFNGRLLAVIYTMRNGVVRIISARRTNKPEDILYGNRPISL